MKVSVIVPIYNVEKYLPSCLDSLLHQGLGPGEYEIICIDDGSTDDSGKIAASYAARFRQIHLVRQENKGNSAARNAGIALACGEYLCFVDSDDYLMKNVLGWLYETAVFFQLDKLLYDYRQIPEESLWKEGKEENWKKEELLFFDNGVQMEADKAVPEWKIAWNYLIRRSVLTRYGLLFHEKVNFMEDQEFSFWLSHCVGKCGYLNKKLYCYRTRRESLIHTFMDEGHFARYIDGRLQLAFFYQETLEKFRRGNPPYLLTPVTGEILEDRMLYEIQGVFSRLLRKGDKNLFEDILRRAKEGKIYPYPLRLRRLDLRQKGKQVIINWITFLYPLEWYLRLCMAVRCCGRGRKKRCG